MLTTFNYIILLSPKAIIMLSQQILSKRSSTQNSIHDCLLWHTLTHTHTHSATIRSSWRRALLPPWNEYILLRTSVQYLTSKKKTNEQKRKKSCYFYCWWRRRKKKRNPLAINVWLCSAIRTSTQLTSRKPNKLHRNKCRWNEKKNREKLFMQTTDVPANLNNAKAWTMFI